MNDRVNNGPGGKHKTESNMRPRVRDGPGGEEMEGDWREGSVRRDETRQRRCAGVLLM